MRNLNTTTSTNNNRKRLTQIPVRTHSDGSRAMLPLANTLITGPSGSGKSALLDDIIGHFQDFGNRGNVECFGIAPKGELDSYRKAGLFSGYTTADSMTVIAPLNKKMRDRFASLKGRYKPSADSPIVLLFVDDADLYGREDELGRLADELVLFGPSVGFYTFVLSQRSEAFRTVEGFRNHVSMELTDRKTEEARRREIKLLRLRAEQLRAEQEAPKAKTSQNAPQPWTAHISTQ